MSRFAVDSRVAWWLRLAWGQIVLLCCLAVPQAHAAGWDRAPDPMPQQFSLAACYQLVNHEGRMIAWARWEQRFSLDKTQSGQFAEGTPAWAIDLVQAWIADAYGWQVTDEQIRQWAEELGNADDLPTAQLITKHETIAIWLRRIARGCDSRREQADLQAPAVARSDEDPRAER